MEKKEIQEWRDRLIKMFGIYHSDGQEYITCPLCGINLDELAKHMIEELDKAREEGFADGVELEQLLNAEFFGEDYQNPKRLKELKKKYNFEDNK